MSKTTQELVEAYRKIKSELDASKMIPEAQMSAIKEEIALRLEEGEENYSDESGYARINKPAKRITYNKKALEKLQDNDPQGVYGWLMDEKYRTEKTAKKGTLAIK